MCYILFIHSFINNKNTYISLMLGCRIVILLYYDNEEVCINYIKILHLTNFYLVIKKM